MSRHATQVHSGVGRYAIRFHPHGYMLYNFDRGSDTVKVEHRRILETGVAPTLRNGGSVGLVGVASRLGGEGSNQRLSLRRAEAVLSYLRGLVPNHFRAAQVTGLGEAVPAQEHVRNGDDNPIYRAVMVYPYTSPVPPPPPPQRHDYGIPPDIGPMLPDASVLDTIGQILDVTNFVAGMVELLSIAILATFLELFGLVTGAASAILALPGAWINADRLARYNGQCQGYWQAMQDMANQYSDPALDTRPQGWWPMLRRPRPHLPQPDPVFLEGQEEGCQKAYLDMIHLESSPFLHTYTVLGRPVSIRLRGRMFLRLLYRAHGSHVQDEIQRLINQRHHAQNPPLRDWPLMQ